jgi:hypothetical protein
MSRSAIRHYDDAGKQLGEIKLQRDGFIIALESLGDDLVATDYRNWRVLRFDSQGSEFGDLSSPAQEEYIEQLRGQVRLYDIATVAAWTLFIVLLVVGVVVAVRHELKKANNMKVAQAGSSADKKPDTRQPNLSEISIQWLKKPRFNLATVMLALIAGLTLGLIVLIPSLEPNKPCSIGQLIMALTLAMVIPIIVPLVVFRNRMHKTRVGVRDEWVIVQFHDSRVEMSRDRDLMTSNNGFIINNRRVGIGNDRHYLYDKKDIEALLQPRLAKAKKLGVGAQMAWEWQHNRRTTLALGVLTVLALALYVALEFGTGKEWMEKQLIAMMGPECEAAVQEKR